MLFQFFRSMLDTCSDAHVKCFCIVHRPFCTLHGFLREWDCKSAEGNSTRARWPLKIPFHLPEETDLREPSSTSPPALQCLGSHVAKFHYLMNIFFLQEHGLALGLKNMENSL